MPKLLTTKKADSDKNIEIKAQGSRPWIFAIFMGLLGALVNSIPFPLLPEINLLLGNAAFVFVAMYLLPKYTLAAAFIALIPVYFIFGHPWGFLTFGLEAWFISHMRSKGWYVLIADMVYWLVIGMPLTFVIVGFQADELTSSDLFLVMKQGFNGLWYTSIACFLMFIFNEKLNIYWRHQSASHRALRTKLMYALVFVTTTALFTATLIISNHFIQTSKSLLAKSLLDSSNNVSKVIDLYLTQNKEALDFSSEWLQAVKPGYYEFILERINKWYPSLQGLTLTDAKGSMHFSYGNVEKQGLVNSNEQVPASLYTLKNEPEHLVTTLSTSFNSMTERGKYLTVEGLLSLDMIKGLGSEKINQLQVHTVIVDANNIILSASPELALARLSKLNFSLLADDNKTLRLPELANQQFIYQVAETERGWKVFSFIDYTASLNAVKSEYLTVFMILFATLIVTTYFADQYGHRLTKPLNFIIDQLSRHDDKKMPSKLSASSEVIHLYKEIITNRDKLYSYQELLEEKVVERTKELNLANKQLEKLALYDGLTQVHNRRFLDDNFSVLQKNADRNTALMALIMVDLDHFKKLNDNHGHLVGDKCLVKTAQLIKKAFDRGTDIVVRFGGEEFVIVAPYITPAALASKLETLRKIISEQLFENEEHNTFHISASFGAVIADASFSDDVLHWVKAADECLYQAKDAGRNCVRISDLVIKL